jgi:hypothetical protein
MFPKTTISGTIMELVRKDTTLFRDMSTVRIKIYAKKSNKIFSKQLIKHKQQQSKQSKSQLCISFVQEYSTDTKITCPDKGKA